MRIKTGIFAALVIAVITQAGQPRIASGQVSQPIPSEVFEALQYRMVGPSRGGRVTTVAGHRAEPSTFYMGATGGGVWKTTNW
ncbi:MAG: hypothetical protein VYE24_02750, partial [Acidobacteriota bacterium]|nr:hypothetical protein [Acidobacteriota bacterium]